MRSPWLLLAVVLLVGFVHSASAQDAPPAGEDTAVIQQTDTVVESEEAPVEPPASVSDRINAALNSALGGITGVINKVLSFSLTGSHEGGKGDFPLIVAWLIFGSVFFTLWFKFVNIRAFKHSIDLIRGKYNDPNDPGEVSHFRALTAALSATVGLGNIAGVAIAIQIGGPGAVFWMTLGGFFGMSMKFAECTLAQMYRHTNPDGSISGGAMYYLERGMREYGPALGGIGKVLAVLFAVLVCVSSVGIGNMFQSNQSYDSVSYTFGIDPGNTGAKVIYGLIMAFLVSIVIIGGIKRIGAATARIVPFMAALYVLAALVIIFIHITEVPAAIATIIKMAFNPDAAYGGAIGVMVWGIKRSTFSNEAGLGSAPIAHSAAKTKEPVREGVVALMEPFIDTIVICNMTALVIVLTGVWHDDAALAEASGRGIVLTKVAFESIISWFPYVLTACVILFAYSTMISWCYYGERGWIYLADHFGKGVGLKTVIIFRSIFVAFVFVGAVVNLSAVIDFSDAMNFAMAFPNILGCLILTPILTRAVKSYFQRLDAGEMKPTK
jgi:AGCS family alanine or glycine:cation symporter